MSAVPVPARAAPVPFFAIVLPLPAIPIGMPAPFGIPAVDTVTIPIPEDPANVAAFLSGFCATSNGFCATWPESKVAWPIGIHVPVIVIADSRDAPGVMLEQIENHGRHDRFRSFLQVTNAVLGAAKQEIRIEEFQAFA